MIKMRKEQAKWASLISYLLLILPTCCLASNLPEAQCKGSDTIPERYIESFRHSHCTLIEYSAFFRSEKLGSFVDLNFGVVNSELSVCKLNRTESSISIDYKCGSLSFGFQKREAGGFQVDQVNMSYVLDGSMQQIFFQAPPIVVEDDKSYYSCDAQTELRFEDPAIDNVTLYVDYVKVDSFRNTEVFEFLKTPVGCNENELDQ